MMPGLPPIDLKDLANVLRDPKMPSAAILSEVADKIVPNCEQSEAPKEKPEVKGMKNLFDCILEVSLLHQDSDMESDDENEEDHEPIVREIPCRYCNKIFSSTMMMKTHVLVTHPLEEKIVLNSQQVKLNEVENIEDHIKPLSSRPNKRSKNSRSTDFDTKGKKSRLSPKKENKQSILPMPQIVISTVSDPLVKTSPQSVDASCIPSSPSLPLSISSHSKDDTHSPLDQSEHSHIIATDSVADSSQQNKLSNQDEKLSESTSPNTGESPKTSVHHKDSVDNSAQSRSSPRRSSRLHVN